MRERSKGNTERQAYVVDTFLKWCVMPRRSPFAICFRGITVY